MATPGVRALGSSLTLAHHAAADNLWLDAWDLTIESVWLDDDAARCRWARAHARLRLLRVEHWYRTHVYFAEVSAPDLNADERRRADAYERAIPRIERLRRRFEANARGAAAR